MAQAESLSQDSGGILVLKTTARQERFVAQILENRAKASGCDLRSILIPAETKGLIFLESGNRRDLEQLIMGIPHAKYILRGETNLDQISHLLAAKPSVKGLEIGDLVEIISGPFRGERAKVKRIDAYKDEVTLELMDTPIPIPITVKGDSVRLIAKEAEV